MMYSEFIKNIEYGETFITETMYHEFIEPVYMNCDLDKTTFCKKFYKLENSVICPAVECLISANDTKTLINYINGEISLDYIKDIEKRILIGFLKRFKREGFNFGK